MKFAIQGVPEDFSNHSIVDPGTGTRQEVVNSLPDTQPHSNIGYAAASQLLHDLAVQDGWAGLYDPGNPESVITNGAGLVTGLRDVMGNFPDLHESSPYSPDMFGSIGSLVTTPTQSVLSTEEFSVPENLTFLGIITRFDRYDAFYVGTSVEAFKPNTNRVEFTQDNTLSVVAGRDMSYSVTNIHQTPGQILAFNTKSRDTWIGYQPTNDIRSEFNDSTLLEDDNGIAISSPRGPFLIMNGNISEGVYERMVELLSQLSGVPVGLKSDVPNPPRTFCTLDDTGKIVSAFCPNRSDRLASVVKILAMHVCRQYIPHNTHGNLLEIEVVDYAAQNSPVMYEGDKLTIEDAYYANILRSQNVVTRQLARHAGKIIDPSSPDPLQTFVDKMNSVASSWGWTNYGFDSPQAGASYATSYDMAWLLKKIRDEDPWLSDVIGTWEHTFTVQRFATSETEVVTLPHIESPLEGAGSAMFPEVTGSKSGASNLYESRTLLQSWKNPLDQEMYFSCSLRAGIYDVATNYQNMRAIYEATKFRNHSPKGYTSPNQSLTSWDRSSSGQNRVVAVRPHDQSPGDITIVPFDFSSRPQPVVYADETVKISAQVRSLSAPFQITGISKVVGGSFNTSSGELSHVVSSPSSFVPLVFSGQVTHGGLLVVEFTTDSPDPTNSLWVNNVSVEVISEDRIVREYVMDVVDYSFTESTQPLDSNDSSGSVGEFSVSLTKPVQRSVIGKYGPGFIREKKCRLITTQGTVSGTIKGIEEEDHSTIRVTGVSEIAPLNAYNVQAPPFSGGLVQLIQLYFGLVSDAAPRFSVHPSLQGRQIVAPGWEGELWYHLKLLCAAERIQITLSSEGGVYVSPATPDKSQPYILSSHGVSYVESNLAEFVEVYKYGNQWRENSIAYPIEGWDSETEILSVNAGEESEYTLELSSSLVDFQQPQLVSFVSSDHIDSSVYTVLGDDDGFPIPPDQWTGMGGNVSFKLNPDTRTIQVKLRGASGILSSTGDPMRSFSLALSAGTGGSRYSTLRIVGTGTFFDRQLIRFPTGVSSSRTGTEVGATIDNPFISSMSQTVKAGSLAAYKFSGSVPLIQTTSPGPESLRWGHASLSRLIEDINEDYRVREATYTPGTVTITGEYYLTWGNWRESLGVQTYQSITDANSGLSYREVQDRGKLYV